MHAPTFSIARITKMRPNVSARHTLLQHDAEKGQSKTEKSSPFVWPEMLYTSTPNVLSVQKPGVK